MGPELCPQCGHRGLSWNPRCSLWLCHMRKPLCRFSESEREHTARLLVADPNAAPVYEETLPEHVRRLDAFEGNPPVPTPDETFYLRCPTCQGSLVIPGSTMNSFACACKGTKTPGYIAAPVQPAEYLRVQRDRDRLIVALWGVAMVDDGSEAAYKAAFEVHGRQTSVAGAMQRLGLDIPDVNEMRLPDHESRRGEWADRPPAERQLTLADLTVGDCFTITPAPGDPAPVERPTVYSKTTPVHGFGDSPGAPTLNVHNPVAGRLERLPDTTRVTPCGAETRYGVATQPWGHPVLFGDLAVGDCFVLAPPSDEMRRAQTCALWEKIVPVPRSRPGERSLNAQEHAKGILADIEDAAPVVRVHVGDWAKRSRQ